MLSHQNDIRIALAGILEEALLMIRSAAWRGDAARCAIEADHVHNLPARLRDTSIDKELIAFYWNVERTAYLAQLSRGSMSAEDSRIRFDPHWKVIERFLKSGE